MHLWRPYCIQDEPIHLSLVTPTIDFIFLLLVIRLKHSNYLRKPQQLVSSACSRLRPRRKDRELSPENNLGAILPLKRQAALSTNSSTYHSILGFFHVKSPASNRRKGKHTHRSTVRQSDWETSVRCPCDETVHLFFDTDRCCRSSNWRQLPLSGVTGAQIAMR